MHWPSVCSNTRIDLFRVDPMVQAETAETGWADQNCETSTGKTAVAEGEPFRANLVSVRTVFRVGMRFWPMRC